MDIDWGATMKLDAMWMILMSSYITRNIRERLLGISRTIGFL